jgi:CcmD family protein
MTININRTAAATIAAIVLVLGLLVSLPAAAAAAQGGQPAAQAQPNDPQSGFVPVKDLPAQEQLPAAPLLIAAYAFVWVVLLVYVWTVWRRLMKVEREVQDLSARLGQKS